MEPPPVCKSVVTLDLAFVNFILICNLDNDVMKSPKRREIISLVFTCLCITKSLLIRVVFGKQIYLTDRATKSVKMVERVIEISAHFCFRCSKINSLTERTEESVLSGLFFKARLFVQQLSSDIPFVYSSLAGEILILKLLIGNK